MILVKANDKRVSNPTVKSGLAQWLNSSMALWDLGPDLIDWLSPDLT